MWHHRAKNIKCVVAENQLKYEEDEMVSLIYGNILLWKDML